MKILHMPLTGLFTTPAPATGNAVADTSIDCGMAVTVDAVMADHPNDEHVVAAFGHAGGRNADDLVTTMIARAQFELGTAETMILILYGHSFGCSLLAFFVQQLRKRFPALRASLKILAFGYDPCKEDFRFSNLAWDIHDSVDEWHTWFQRNGIPWGVKAGGYADPKGGNNTDVSGRPNPTYGVTFGHIDGSDIINGNYVGIPNSPQIRDETRKQATGFIYFMKAAA